jgi:hypothetical protein
MANTLTNCFTTLQQLNLMSRDVLSEQLTDMQATITSHSQRIRVKDQRDQLRYQDLSKKQLAT